MGMSAKYIPAPATALTPVEVSGEDSRFASMASLGGEMGPLACRNTPVGN